MSERVGPLLVLFALCAVLAGLAWTDDVPLENAVAGVFVGFVALVTVYVVAYLHRIRNRPHPPGFPVETRTGGVKPPPAD